MSESLPVYLFAPPEDGLPPFPSALAELATSGAPLALSPGYLEGIPAVEERLAAAGLRLGLLSFRHDINNPLLAALAETQLLLLDAEPGSETEESMRVVEEQLRPIRDLVAEMTPLRIPRR